MIKLSKLLDTIFPWRRDRRPKKREYRPALQQKLKPDWEVKVATSESVPYCPLAYDWRQYRVANLGFSNGVISGSPDPLVINNGEYQIND